MARAQALLALTATPRTMPCRDNERAAITAFVEESVITGEACCPAQPAHSDSSLAGYPPCHCVHTVLFAGWQLWGTNQLLMFMHLESMLFDFVNCDSR